MNEKHLWADDELCVYTAKVRSGSAGVCGCERHQQFLGEFMSYVTSHNAVLDIKSGVSV